MALPIALLVSEEKLKSFTSINFNTSPADLKPYVLDAQNILLPNYIGATYYNALRTRLIAGTLTVEDTNLLDNYLGYMLCNWGLYYALPFLKFRMYNKGVLSGTSENSNNSDLNELKFLQSQVKMIAESYTEQMLIFLRNHSSEYPLYSNANILDGELPDRSNSYTSSLTIPHTPYGAGRRLRNGYNLPDTNQ